MGTGPGRAGTSISRVRAVQRSQPRSLTAAEVSALRELAHDLPGIWLAATQEERQTLVRLLLERVVVEVIGDSEQVRVICHWHGGHQTSHELIRPAARLNQLSTNQELVARAVELRSAGKSCTAIAEILDQEGRGPAKRRDTFNAPMVQRLFCKVGTIKYRRQPVVIERQPNEWTIVELARHLAMPASTLYNGVQEGRLQSRMVPQNGMTFRLVHADEATIAAVKEVRATPPPWRRRPPRIDEAILADHPEEVGALYSVM